jgi:hypothetical protein
MAFRPHSTDQYNLLFHNVWCLGRRMDVAAKEANMNETHAFRAATGWANGKDGAVGRTAFLEWRKGACSEEGASCCGGRMVPGKRKPPEISAERLAALATLDDIEAAREKLLKDLVSMRKKLGLPVDGDTSIPDSIK